MDEKLFDPVTYALLKNLIGETEDKFPVSVQNGGTGGTSKETAVNSLGLGKMSATEPIVIAKETKHELVLSAGLGLFMIAVGGNDKVFAWIYWGYGTDAVTHRWQQLTNPTHTNVTITTAYNKITVDNQSQNTLTVAWINAIGLDASITDTLITE